jgi:hypothetical protein
MHNEVSPPIIAITLMVAIVFSGFVLWRFADIRHSSETVSAREMLADVKTQNDVMARYREKFGGGGTF